MVVAALTTAFLAQCLKPIFDDIFIGHQKERLFYIALGVLSIFIIKGISEYGATLCMEHVGLRIMNSLQQHLFDHLVFLDLDFFRKSHEGHITSLLLNDIRTIKNSVLQATSGILNQGFTIVGLIYVMVHQNPSLSLASFVGLPLVMGLLVYSGRKVRAVALKLSRDTGSLQIFFQQIFQNIALVKAYHTEAQESLSLKSRLIKLTDQMMQVCRIRSLIHPIMEIMGGIAIVIVIVIGGVQVMEGTQTTGSFLAFITALLFVYRPLKTIIQMNTTLQEGLAATERIQDILMTQETLEKQARCTTHFIPQPKSLFHQDIVLDHVGFTYPEAHQPLFKALSCRFKGGMRSAIVGPSGAGKTTLFHLLLRFYRPQQGCIRLGDVDFSQVNLQNLREHMALVSQDISLFDDTIAANISYGMNASLDQIREASSLAFADEFIDSLPLGYQTPVGSQGVKLSGGQRQRISLARAFLRNAPILLLDEATSALDGTSEKKIQEATMRLSQERTTLIIAHRFSTIEHANTIFVLNHGDLVQEGSHTELIAMPGLYKELALSQKFSAE
jgi:subfamily B ATP-binding cassette protein MsbA